MKKMNKKGFTLIELLAVIIILGVLMIIAIPSVTTYIQNSRKSAYVDTAAAYVEAVRTKVNEGKDLRLFSTSTLYLIPVGDKTKDASGHSCVSVESGGQSPFSDTWNYAYVGVTYDGKGYNYFFVGEDGAGQGIAFLPFKALTDEGTGYIYSSQSDSQFTTAVTTTNKEHMAMTNSLVTALKNNYGTEFKTATTAATPVYLDNKTNTEAMLNLAKGTASGEIVIVSDDCKYSGEE